MALNVTVADDGGMVLVTVTGGGDNFSQSFSKAQVAVRREDGSPTLQLLKIATDETIVSFDYSECSTPTAASAALLHVALDAILGAGAAAGAATAANQATLNDLVGEAQVAPTNQYSILGMIKKIWEQFFLIVSNGAVKIVAPVLPLPTGASTFSAQGDILAAVEDVGSGIAAIGVQIGAISSPATGTTNERLELLQNTFVGIGMVFAPKTGTITQLTTTGQSSGFNALGGVGSFLYIFVKNGGTSGLISLDGTNDGTNWVAIPMAITASLVADGKGLLTWTTPFLQVRVSFAQTGAGSTVDGTFYAK